MAGAKKPYFHASAASRMYRHLIRVAVRLNAFEKPVVIERTIVLL
jgi:hypothetical protein